jgi:hypothetical protein
MHKPSWRHLTPLSFICNELLCLQILEVIVAFVRNI